MMSRIGLSCATLLVSEGALPPGTQSNDFWPLRHPDFTNQWKSRDQITRDSDYDPGQRAPPLILPTLAGDLDIADLIGSPVLFNAFVPGWGFSEALWGSGASIDEFVARAPSNAHFVFMSYGEDHVSPAVGSLREMFGERMSIGQTDLESRLHFVSASVEQLGSQASTAWIASMFQQYPTVLDSMEATLPSDRFNVPMVNSMYDWLGWPFTPSGVFGNASVGLADFGDGCMPTSDDLSGRIALVADGTCDYYAKVKAAASLNASGVAVISSASSAPISINCAGDDECSDYSFGIPAFMIGNADGARLLGALAAGLEPTLTFQIQASPGTDFGIDAAGRLQQTWGGSGLGNAEDTTSGNPGDDSCKLYPSLEFVAWAAQYLNFKAGVDAQISVPAHKVSVLVDAPLRPMDGNCYGADPWGCGPSAAVAVPSSSQTGPMGLQFTRLELQFDLGCGDGPRDIDCPKWDHVITILGCCGDAAVEDLACDAATGFEIGRYITTFGRGIGHSVTDVSSLLPLLSGDRGTVRSCNLTAFAVPWAGNQGSIPWTATMSLRFLEPPQPPAHEAFKVLTPWSDVSTSDGTGVYEYFKWIAFNQSYETYFAPFEFDLPAGTKKAELMVVISGHGNDNHGCGEFCSTEHHFTINGHPNVQNLNNPDNPRLGCGDSVFLGTTPNEYGTWLYGRDGWCNGREVAPWIVDVTDQLEASGNVLKYQGLFNSSVPDPSTLQQGAPVMMMRAYVTFFKEVTANPAMIV